MNEPPEVVRTLVANQRSFLRFVEKRVGSRQLAEEILQAAFVHALARAASVRRQEAIVAWFSRVLRNAIADHFRKAGRRERALERFAAALGATGTSDERVEREICRCVGRLAKTLKSDYADALQRIDVDGIPVRSFAEERGISSSNAAVRVFRARQALKRRVARSCGACSTHGCLDCSCEVK